MSGNAPLRAGIGVAKLTSVRSPVFFPNPERCEHKERTDNSSNDISQRDGDLIQTRPDSEQTEQQTAEESTGEAKTKISERTEALLVPRDDAGSETTADKPDDDPNDEVIKRQHRATTRAW